MRRGGGCDRLETRDAAPSDARIRRLPALLAAVTGAPGDASGGVLRTWLDPDPPAKADLAHPRCAPGSRRFSAPPPAPDPDPGEEERSGGSGKPTRR